MYQIQVQTKRYHKYICTNNEYKLFHPSHGLVLATQRGGPHLQVLTELSEGLGPFRLYRVACGKNKTINP